MTCLSFFAEVVLMQGIGRTNLSDTSKLDESSSSLLLSSTCRASYLLCKGIWEGGGVAEGTCPLCHTGTCWHCPLSFQSLRSIRWRGESESSVLCTRSDCWAHLREGRTWFQQSISFSHSLTLLSLLTSSQSSVTKQRSSSTWVHLVPSCTGVTAGHTKPGWLHVSPPEKLCQSWRVQSLEKPRLSATWKPSLPGQSRQSF